MNINAFIASSSSASGESLGRNAPLENPMGLSSRASQSQKNEAFTLVDLSSAFPAEADNNDDILSALADAGIELDAEQLAQLASLEPAESRAALLAYLANGGVTTAETPAQAAEQPSIANNQAVQNAPQAPVLRSEQIQPDVTGATSPSVMAKTLMDKTDSTTSLPSFTTVMAGAQGASLSGETLSPAAANWSTVKLPANQQNWTQQLQTVLSDRLQIQSQNNIQHATIRLDPPAMGKIDISLFMDGGRLQVQINANQQDVYRALQQISHDLRVNLTEQNFSQVSVQITSNGQQQHHGQQHRQMFEQAKEAEIVAQQSEPETTVKEKDDTLLTTA